MTYQFVGSGESQILRVVDGRVVGSEVLSEYGQRIELDDDQALNAIAGGCALVPEGEFSEDRPSMQKLAAEMIHHARETGALPAAEIQSGNEVIDGNRE